MSEVRAECEGLLEGEGMKSELKLNVSLNVDDETARLCARLLASYCDKQRGDFDIGPDACKDCALVDLNGYCYYRQAQVWMIKMEVKE